MTTSEALNAARALLRQRLDRPERSRVPSPPATRLLQIGGLASTVEQRLCDETLGLLLEAGGREPGIEHGHGNGYGYGYGYGYEKEHEHEHEPGPGPSSILVVDLSTVGRATAVWLGRMLPLLAEGDPQPRITLLLPGTRRAGRGRLLGRHVAQVSAEAGVEVELLCGPVSPAAAAPEGSEVEVLRQGFDLILALSLSGSAGLTAPWPSLPGRRWLELAHAAVLSFVDPAALPDDLPRLHALWPARAEPIRIAAERLDGPEPEALGQLELTDPAQARQELAPLIDEDRALPWRLVVSPPPGRRGTAMACLDDAAARALAAPLIPRRTLGAGRLRLVAAERES